MNKTERKMKNLVKPTASFLAWQDYRRIEKTEEGNGTNENSNIEEVDSG